MNPQLGEIKNGLELGYKRDGKYIWAACTICGKERWVSVRGGQPIHSYCYQSAYIIPQIKIIYNQNLSGLRR